MTSGVGGNSNQGGVGRVPPGNPGINTQHADAGYQTRLERIEKLKQDNTELGLTLLRIAKRAIGDKPYLRLIDYDIVRVADTNDAIYIESEYSYRNGPSFSGYAISPNPLDPNGPPVLTFNKEPIADDLELQRATFLTLRRACRHCQGVIDEQKNVSSIRKLTNFFGLTKKETQKEPSPIAPRAQPSTQFASPQAQSPGANTQTPARDPGAGATAAAGASAKPVDPATGPTRVLIPVHGVGAAAEPTANSFQKAAYRSTKAVAKHCDTSSKRGIVVDGQYIDVKKMTDNSYQLLSPGPENSGQLEVSFKDDVAKVTLDDRRIDFDSPLAASIQRIMNEVAAL